MNDNVCFMGTNRLLITGNGIIVTIVSFTHTYTHTSSRAHKYTCGHIHKINGNLLEKQKDVKLSSVNRDTHCLCVCLVISAGETIRWQRQWMRAKRQKEESYSDKDKHRNNDRAFLVHNYPYIYPLKAKIKET